MSTHCDVSMVCCWSYDSISPSLKQACRNKPYLTFLLPKKAQNQLQHFNLHPDPITFHPLTIPYFDLVVVTKEDTRVDEWVAEREPTYHYPSLHPE
ncbi:hypothetical protein ACOSQ2_031207 [Xanthoceras sorbifolium]